MQGNIPKSPRLWLFLVSFGVVLVEKEPTPTTGELLINFDKIWRNRCFFCENRPEKCPKRPKMFFQILKGFPICFPIYCEPKRSARLKYYRASQDRVWSDSFGLISEVLGSIQIRPVWGKLIQQMDPTFGSNRSEFWPEWPKKWFSIQNFRIFGFLTWTSGFPDLDLLDFSISRLEFLTFLF